MKNHLATLLVIFLFINVVSAQNAYFTVEEKGVEYSIVDRLKTHDVNGAAIAVVRNFAMDTIFQIGVRDKNENLPVDKNTLFQMGSMTVPLVKFAVLRLVNDGKIELDTDANQYLKRWKIEGKSFLKKNPVTVRDLLLQRRGFNPIYKSEGYAHDEVLPTIIQILNGEKPSQLPALKLEKNMAKKSSIANILILQLLLEDIHQQSFATLMSKQVFEPLEMHHSIIAADLKSENAAIGYLEKEKSVPNGHRIYPELAHSGLWSTPEDYAKFILHIFKAAKGMDNSLLNKSLAKQGIEPQNESVALIFNKSDNSYFGGASKGFYGQFSGSAEEGWIVVGCTNRELAWKFVNWELNLQAIKYAKR